MAILTEKLPKHHYFPVLYLKQWAVNGRLSEFTKPNGRTRVEVRGSAPRGTGYVRGLYRLFGVSPEAAEEVERTFMGPVDNVAKQALNILLSDTPRQWTPQTRNAWSRFVMGLDFRSPEWVGRTKKMLHYFRQLGIDNQKKQYEAMRGPGDPDFDVFSARELDYFVKQSLMLHMDSTKIRELFTGMRWNIIDASTVGRTLFTSDRPIIQTDGLAHSDSYLMLPISPTRLFIATNQQSKEDSLRSRGTANLVKACNKHVIRRAQKYAWHQNEKELEFVRKHLSVEDWVHAHYTIPPMLKELAEDIGI